MKRNIYFWHGKTIELQNKLIEIPGVLEDNGELFYMGSLDDFEKFYDGSFMVMKDGSLCVTFRRNFSQA